jgi:hypothetical protein
VGERPQHNEEEIIQELENELLISEENGGEKSRESSNGSREPLNREIIPVRGNRPRQGIRFNKLDDDRALDGPIEPMKKEKKPSQSSRIWIKYRRAPVKKGTMVGWSGQRERDEELFHLAQGVGLETGKITGGPIMVIIRKMKWQKMNHRRRRALRRNRPSIGRKTSGPRGGRRMKWSWRIF